MEKERPYYLEHRKRLKERFGKAPEAVNDAEILELLLGYVIRRQDVKPQSKAILEKTKKLCNVFEAEFAGVKGLGSESVLFFEILREFINRADYQKIEKKEIDLTQVDAVYKFLKLKIGTSTKENFVLLFLDIKKRLIAYEFVRTGFIDSVDISAREIIESAIKHKASAVIIAHNHPSGDSSPSEADLEMTRRLCHALKYTGINLTDHMIVSFHEHYSMALHGHIKDFGSSTK